MSAQATPDDYGLMVLVAAMGRQSSTSRVWSPTPLFMLEEFSEFYAAGMPATACLKHLVMRLWSPSSHSTKIIEFKECWLVISSVFAAL